MVGAASIIPPIYSSPWAALPACLGPSQPGLRPVTTIQGQPWSAQGPSLLPVQGLCAGKSLGVRLEQGADRVQGCARGDRGHNVHHDIMGDPCQAGG